MNLGINTRVLVTGGAIGDIPLIRQAISMGYEVYTSGNRPNDPGHLLSKRYIDSNYTDVKAIAKIVTKFNIKYIIPSCHDTAYIAAAGVAQKLNLPGFDTSELATIIHSKDKLALAIKSCGLNGIETVLLSELDAAKEFFFKFDKKVVVKPSDMTGGRGVSFVFDLMELETAVEKARAASQSKVVLMQRYIEGSEHGFTAILKKGKVAFSFFDDEYRHLNRYRVAGTISPSSVSELSKQKLIDWMDTFSKFYKLKDGLVHLQFLEQSDGPVVLEMCRRPPGDFYPLFVESSTNYPYSRNVINGYFGLNVEEQSVRTTGPLTTFRHVVTANKNGFYRGLEISDKVRLAEGFNLEEFKQPGDLISDYLNETLAIAIFKVTPDEKTPLLEQIKSHFIPVIDS